MKKDSSTLEILNKKYHEISKRPLPEVKSERVYNECYAELAFYDSQIAGVISRILAKNPNHQKDLPIDVLKENIQLEQALQQYLLSKDPVIVDSATIYLSYLAEIKDLVNLARKLLQSQET